MRRPLVPIAVAAAWLTLSARLGSATPQSRILSPSNGAVLTTPPASITGTATETAPVTFKRKKRHSTRTVTSGVSFVQIELRASDGTWWNGVAWTKKERWIVAKGQANWELDCARVRWQAGKTYVVRSRAVNGRRRVESPFQNVMFRIGIP